MNILALILTFLLILISQIKAEQDKLSQHPTAVQFREHLLKADANKDGYITRDELTAEVEKGGKRPPEQVKEIVDSMMEESDQDHDGRISRQEIEVGARATAIRAIIRDDARIAEDLMQAIDEFRKKYNGNIPKTVGELAKAKLISEEEVMCKLADGSDKPWIIDASASDANAVLLYSPGSVDLEGQYIVGLVNGRVLGLHDKDLDITKLKRLHVYSSE